MTLRPLLLGACAAALACASTAAQAVPVNIAGQVDSATETSTTVNASGACPVGAVVAVFVSAGTKTVTTLKDTGDNSTSAYTQVANFDSHGAIALYKKVLTAPIVAGATPTQFVATFAATSNVALYAYCVADGVSIPTTGDGSYNSNNSATQNASTTIVGASASTSYQIAGLSTYLASISDFPASTSTGNWQPLDNVTLPNGYGFATAYQANPPIAPTTTSLKSTASANTYNNLAWAEVGTTGVSGPASAAHLLNLMGVGR